MKLLLLILFSFPFSLFSQSLFGFNDSITKVIDKDLYNEWNIEGIYEIYKHKNNQTGGMNNNWSMTVWNINTDNASEEWVPIYRDSGFIFNYDSIVFDYRVLNGFYVNLKNGELQSYGGSGYGSFDFYDFYKINDSLKLGVGYCTGHCSGSGILKFSKNIYSENGLIYSAINYNINEFTSENDISFDFKFVKTLDSIAKNKKSADTTFYLYTKNPTKYLGKLKDIVNISNTESHSIMRRDYYDFYNCFINKEKMEDFIYNKVGYHPQTLYFQYYKFGAFVFEYDEISGKYINSDLLLLE